MDEEFVTAGLETDRYLKADRLVHRFEEAVLGEIRETCDRIVGTNGDLFGDVASYDPKVLGAEYNRTLATIRVECDMTRRNETGDVLKLNVAVEWVEPDEQETGPPVDGSLRYALYKIQHGADGRFDAVRRRTDAGDWGTVRFGEDQWAHHTKQAPGIVYVPVEDGPGLAAALRTLGDHFTAEYAPALRE